MICWIMQGESGSGKTTRAKALKDTTPGVVILSTDDYFDGPHGYVFVREKLGEAHEWNKRRAVAAMDRKRPVVIDNTNTRAWEARGYVREACRRSYEVVFVRCEGRFKNCHGVPEDVVESMRSRLEELTVEKCLAARVPWEPDPAPSPEAQIHVRREGVLEYMEDARDCLTTGLFPPQGPGLPHRALASCRSMKDFHERTGLDREYREYWVAVMRGWHVEWIRA